MRSKRAQQADTATNIPGQTIAQEQPGPQPSPAQATIEPASRIAAIILAAGASTRLGEPKQLVTLAGERLLERTIRIAGEAGCMPIVVVLGASAELIQTHAKLSPAQIVVNEGWLLGLASSIRVGLAHLDSSMEAAVLMTCDQPAVSASHLRCLMAAATKQIVASSYAGRRGVPACFPAHSFCSLRSLNGDTGARDLLQTAHALELPDGALDIDTPAALLAARARYE